MPIGAKHQSRHGLKFAQSPCLSPAPTPMTDTEVRALVSLIADNDREVRGHVEEQLMLMGETAIPWLEQELDTASFDGDLQDRIVNLIHKLQFDVLIQRLQNWHLLGGTDLLQGMWIVSTYQYPDLDIATLRQVIDRLYYETWLQLRDDMNPYDQIRILNQVLLDEFKLGPNSRNFQSPGNSMINVVIESKKGNPITLCVIYMLVAQKLGLPIYGVNLPNMFILTYKTLNTQFYINVFNRGIIFSRQDIENYIRTLKIQPIEVFFEPCTTVDIIRRVLRNLIGSFEHLGEHYKVEEVTRLKDLLDD
jgi:regulator of sirC expression with transglutaminase-like and TPR domain